MTSRTVRILAAVGIAYASACTSNPARSAVAVPLEIPEPPPRVAIDPVPAPVAEVSQPEKPSPAAPVPAVRTAPPPSTAPAATTTPPAPAPPPVAEPARPTPAPELQPAGPPGRTPTAAQVQEALRRTKQKLDSIDRRRLNAGKRADYDSARRFLVQAEAAVRANNLLLADSSAEKAETLADGLK